MSRANAALGAAAIFNHHLLMPQLGQFIAQNAREAVGAAAGRERNNKFHRLGRLKIRSGIGGSRSKAEENGYRAE